MKYWIENHERDQAQKRSKREYASVVRIQALGRGRAVRKKVVKMKKERAKEVVEKYIRDKKARG